MTAFDFKPAERDKVERNEDPGHMFVHSLIKQGKISRTDIGLLTEKLKMCDLSGVANDVNESFTRYKSQMQPQPSVLHEHDRGKLTHVVKEDVDLV